MNVTFACPHCQETGVVPLTAQGVAIDCPHCHARLDTPAAAWEENELKRCLVCGGGDLFVRKDFPPQLGLAIIVGGFALSCVTWFFYWTYLTFAVLFATALADLTLYFIVGESLVCYRCHAEYRRLSSLAKHGPFSLETHERYRQLSARLGQAERAAAARAADQVPSASETTGH